jgi:hypothetical protein
MRDLMAVPGEAAMAEYIAGRRERGLVLRVIRTRDHDWPGGWLTSARDYRVVKHAPEDEGRHRELVLKSSLTPPPRSTSFGAW